MNKSNTFFLDISQVFFRPCLSSEPLMLLLSQVGFQNINVTAILLLQTGLTKTPSECWCKDSGAGLKQEDHSVWQIILGHKSSKFLALFGLQE